MTSAILIEPLRTFMPRLNAKLGLAVAAVALLALVLIGPDRLIAQIEGDRGVPSVASSSDIHVTGIEINVKGDSGEDARSEGWRIAQRKAWAKINGPKMSDGQLSAMVSAIVIEKEQIGPRRYVARLGVIFDRTRAGAYVGTAGGRAASRQSAPMLTIPILYSGGVRQVFEVRGPWQRAWANFQTAGSPVEYVRPSGAGGESLILTAGQVGRRSRKWWRNVLGQFESADAVSPVARLERQWPGGPVRGTFTARYGPDNTFLDSFTMSANDENKVPEMLAKAVIRMDGIYRRALADGLLKPDPTLLSGDRAFDAALAKLRAHLGKDAEPDAEAGTSSKETSAAETATGPALQAVSTFSVQFASPDAAAVDRALAAVRGVSGVRGAATTSLAIGGTSVMRVTAAGGLDAMAAALRSQGWQVTVGSNALRISR